MRYFLSVLLFFVFFVVVCHGTDSNFVFSNSKANSVRDVSIKDEIVSGEENLRELLKKNGLFFRLSMRKNGDDLYVGEFRLHENKFPKTGAHLHYSIYTQDNVSFSDTTMKLLLGLDYSKDSMYNGSWRTVYNPSKLFEIYKD